MSKTSIMFKQILPNVMTPIIVSTTTNVAYFILQEAALSFIGLGVADSTPTWGNILNAAKSIQVVQNQWWIWVFPGLAISLLVLAINFLGDGLRDVLVAGDYQVLRENRKRVDLDVVFSVLSSVELDVELFRRPVFGTEEALSRRNALRVSLGSGRSHPARVELQQHRLPVDGQPTRPHRLERAEIGGSHRPYRQLVPDEFAKLFHSRARSLSR